MFHKLRFRYFSAPTSSRVRSHKLRKLLLFEIVLVFSLYIAIFVVTGALLYRQQQLTERVRQRGEDLALMQTLERQLNQIESARTLYAATPNRVIADEVATRYAAYSHLLASIQGRMRGQLSTDSSFATEQNIAYQLSRLHAAKGIVLEQLTQQTLVSEESQSARILIGAGIPDAQIDQLTERTRDQIFLWRELLREDLTHLINTSTYNQRLYVAALATQGLLVILSLIVLAYTYVSPSFERLLKRLHEKNEELRRIDKLKTEFLSITSHQLRTPLSEVSWNLSLMRRHVSNPKAVVYAKRAQESIASMVSLVALLLNMSRIEQDRLEYRPEDVDITQVLKRAMLSVKVSARQKGIRFRDSLPHKRVLIAADPLLCQQVVTNILQNAVDYNREGGEITVSLKREAKHIVAEIQDTGMGMSPSELKQLFIKYSRSPIAKKVRPGGIGLGLYFVKKVMRLHGGDIRIASTPGVGTHVELRFGRS